MDRSSSSRPDPDSSSALDALAALLECEADLDAVERGLLAAAVHPQSAGCERAWLLRWDARRARLVGGRIATRADVPGTLAHALASARRAAPAVSREEREWSLWSRAPESLPPALATAWKRATAVGGDSSEDTLTPWAGPGAVGAVILSRGARAFGLLVGHWEAAPSLDALTRLADAGSRALAAQSRAAEARRRARHTHVLAEFARAAVCALNIAEALHLLARGAAQGLQVRGSAVFRARADGTLRLEVAHGPAALRDAFAAGLAPFAAEAMQAQRVLGDGVACASGPLPANLAGEIGVWTVVPIVAYGHGLGALALWDGNDRAPGSPELERGDAEFLAALCDQAALLLEHARRLEDLDRNELQRRELTTRLHEQDRLASIGEMAERVAQESRNPLASIAAFAKRAHRGLAEDDPQREYLEIVLRESERLEAMLREQLRYAQLERPRLRVQSLNAVVQAALQSAGETLVRRRVRLVKKLAPDLPELLLDAPRLQRVVENVVAFALEAVPLGGRIRVESRRQQDFALVEIAHDGAREGGDLLEQLFVPFVTGREAGASIGLGVAQQIVREHGGEIRVRSEGEWGAVFSFTLPISGNEDRRLASDRRGGGRERRRRAPDA